MTRIRRETLQRLWDKVRIQDNGCWLFMGAGSGGPQGYGSIRVDSDFGLQPTMRVHRVSYMAFRGEIPEGMDVLHHCDTPRCIRPDHLFVGYQAANNRDMREKGRNDEFGHKRRRREELDEAA